MAAALRNFYNRLTPASSNVSLASTKEAGFTKAKQHDALFPKTDPAVDGEECLHDCSSCSIKYPRSFSIDEEEALYGHVKGWSTHLIVATGKTDWVRDVADEKGSVMEAVEKSHIKPTNGRLMLSASNMPVYTHCGHSTTVLLLPSFQLIDHVTPDNTPELIREFVNKGPTNMSPLTSKPAEPAAESVQPQSAPSAEASPTEVAPTISPAVPTSTSSLKARPCPHKYLILLCSQKTRDARCGQSAPLLLKEFERHLRPLGLHRDLHDERPGGVGIYFISHVGGHKFSANVMIYRTAAAVKESAHPGEHTDSAEEALKKVQHQAPPQELQPEPTLKEMTSAKYIPAEGSLGPGVGLPPLNSKFDRQYSEPEYSQGQDVVLDVNRAQEEEGNGEAAQCIWLARVRPEDCENIIKYTVLQGKVVKPERQLRGGFDRTKQLVSW